MAPALPSSTLPDPSSDERCPNCSATRYMNTQIRFLISAICYHKMCATCVDRIFSAGPAPCPIAGCREILRKTNFRRQTFADAKIEREVDIRRRVDKVLGGYTEADFLGSREWNDYLEMVEDLAYDLANNVEYARNLKKLEELERRQKEEKGGAAKGSVFENVGRVGGVKKVNKTGLPKALPDVDAASNGSATGLVIRGLRVKEAKVEEEGTAEVIPEILDPFGGMREEYTYTRFVGGYDVGDERLAKYKRVDYLNGGYDLDAWCQRSLVDAFSGLGVFVAEERNNAVAVAVEGKVNAGKEAAKEDKKQQQKAKATRDDDDVF